MNNSTSYSFSVKTKNEVLTNTYFLLALSLIPTAIGALIGANISFAFLMNSPIIGMLGLFAVMFILMFIIEKNKTNPPIGIFFLLLFTFFMGVLLGPILQTTLKLNNGGRLIFFAAILTTAVFFTMSAIAYTIKKETTFLTDFLAIGSIVLLAAVILNIFLQLPSLYLVLTCCFVVFSSLLIIWQINQILIGGEKNYISATLTLFISVYNLFTSILQLFVRFK